jgi:hypothetical protein
VLNDLREQVHKFGAQATARINERAGAQASSANRHSETSAIEELDQVTLEAAANPDFGGTRRRRSDGRSVKRTT